MKLFKNTRDFNLEEMQILNLRLAGEQKKLKEILKYKKILIHGIIALICIALIKITGNELLLIGLGTIAMISLGYVLFTPICIYYDQKYLRAEIKKLNGYINNGKATVFGIHSKRIAEVAAVVDEFTGGTPAYFLVELDVESVLFYRDTQYIFIAGFPCLDFDIYATHDAFFLGKPICPLSKIIDPIILDEKARCCYEKKFGTPTFGIKDINFDKLIGQYNNC
ncbi:hypothetical protein [Pedobacter psychrodurus]|uniref:hypothetical protein n=1 Tax=Pedobacter psychrodurus TaxID=2530456 RepID=UPI0029313330|nr:hypothetical protein [Pedobacter psychrodurus]